MHPWGPGRRDFPVLPLFEPHRLARKGDPSTSKAAANSTEELRETHWGAILKELVFGPGTSEELAERCGLPHAAVWRRMGELYKAGHVVRTDEKRPNRSGRMAFVWRRSHVQGPG